MPYSSSLVHCKFTLLASLVTATVFTTAVKAQPSAIPPATSAPARAGAPPSAEELTVVNQALRTLIEKQDPSTTEIFSKHPDFQLLRAPLGPVSATPPAALIPRDSEPFTPNSFKDAKSDLVSLVIAGDSTAQTGDPAHRGWAALLVDYFDPAKINLVNPSIGGRSFRSFYHEGRWDTLVAGLKKGDIVMIQFGHNDGGSFTNPNGRPDLPGEGDETQTVTRTDGTTEVVHTLGWYLRKYIQDVKAKGAMPIVLGDTPYDRWTNGEFVKKAGDFSAVTEKVADEEHVQFIDLTAVISDHLATLPQEEVRKLFNADNLHTTTVGAIVNAEMFVAAIKANNLTPLADALNDKGKAIASYKPADAKPAATPSAPAADTTK